MKTSLYLKLKHKDIMTVFEIIDINSTLLKVMSDNGINTSDVNHLEMYKEFVKLRNDGVKVRYIATVMAQQYKMTERSVFRIVRSFNRSVKVA